MTLGDALGLSDTQERILVRLLQSGLAGIAVYGVVTGQPGMVVSGLLTLSVTLVPALLRREYGYTMDAGLGLWITLAVVLHAVGSLGLYSQFSWYDEITHTVSATVVAGSGYATFRAFELHSGAIDIPSAFLGVFVLAFGVGWEVFEFGTPVVARWLGVGSPVTVCGIDDHG